MERLKTAFSYLAVPIGVLALQACSGLGYQGGAIPTTFSGIDLAQAVSPQTIQLNWTAYPGASKYNVYSPDKNDPVYTPGFNAILFKPVPNDPTLTYQYSVTAIDPSNGKEQGERSVYSPVQLLSHFNFKNSGSATGTGKTTMRVAWSSYPSVSYMVYVAERLPTGQVNYNNFVASYVTVSGKSSATITGLSEGHEYCAVVVAAYSDQTNDTPNGTLFTGEVGATLSSDFYLKGVSGNFGDSIIAQSQKCARTQSDFSVTNLKIYAQKASLSSQPIFYVSVPGDTSEDTIGTVSTSIYQVNEVTGLSSLVGTRIGTGKVSAQSAIPSGRYHFFAVVNDLSSTAQAKVEIIAGPTGSTPATDQDRKWIYVRAFNATETQATTTGYYPEKQQAGYGAQRAGSSVAIGDFNCDGKKDLAIGVPEASLMASDNRPAKQGKVIIYYDQTDGTPSTTSRIQTVSFDITGFAGDAGRDLRLGTSLYVGNFNKDNQASNQSGGSGLSSVFQCDDLAIGSGYGPMFVLYGKRDVAPGDGGLNYVNPTSYTLNPSASCDPSSNVCQVGVYTQGTNYSYNVGQFMTSGDYNGDGYEDLAVTSSSGGFGYPHGIWVFRGSEYGLIAPTAYTGGVDTVVTTSGPYLSFPYLPVSATAYAAPTPGPGWASTAGFGSSISTFHNAYYDTDAATKTKGSKRIRDVLLVGNTTNSVVHACLPKSNYAASTWGTIGSTNDVNSNFVWDCSGEFSAPVGIGGFGTAMTDLKNPLRYRPDQFTDTGCAEGFGNCSVTSTNLGYPGGFAVSAVSSTVNNAAYVYYGVNNPVAYAVSNPNTVSNRDTMGINRNTNFTQMMAGKRFDGTTLLYTTGTACNAATNAEYCDIQKIQHPTTGAGQFGLVLGTLAGTVAPSGALSKDSILAVAAPTRNFTLSGGTSYANVGSVQLYLQNSAFEFNPIIVRASTASGTACDNTGVCRYSDGFSNSLTTSLDYDGQLSDNVYFGLGGIVSGPLLAQDSNYNTNSDVVVGAPGHVARLMLGGLNQNVIDNGAAVTFFSHSGTYRGYQPTDSGATNSPWHIVDRSFSQESDMKFHEVISIGDINQDSIGDVAVRINQGTRNMLRIYSGRSDKVGFATDPGSYTTFQIQGDATAGIRFVPVGSVTTSTLPAFWVTGNTSSYLMFAGIGGLVGGFPTAFGTGGTPRKFYNPGGTICDPAFDVTLTNCYSYLDFGDNQYYNTETAGNLDTTLRGYTSFAQGDFNGDGYQDFAIGFSSSPSIADSTLTKGCAGNYCANTGVGRVMIFYGGSDNGFQTQPNLSGGYPLTNSYFADYSADNVATHAYFGAPCATDGTGCKIQMLHENTTLTYGQSIASVPAGMCTNGATGVQYPVNSLVVKATKAGGASLYIYRPKCLDTSNPNDFSGLVSYAENSSTAATLALPPGSSVSVGLTMVSADNLMGSPIQAPARPDIISHFIVTDQTNSRAIVYPVHTIDANKSTIEAYTVNADGGRLIDYSASAMMSGTNGTNTLFGSGLASVGDVNGDGYADVGIAIGKLARKDTATQVAAQGTVMVLFGGPTGLQSHTNLTYTSAIEPSRTSTCYISPNGTSAQTICNPALLYVPQSTNSIRNGAYERTSLMPSSFVRTPASTNEGLGTFLIGVPGRDSLDTAPTDRVLQGGAFYVLP